MTYSSDSYLQLSGIQHFAFCKRQWALIHIAQQWDKNERTVKGNIVHENVDGGIRRETRMEVTTFRAVPVSSSRLGLSGICDVVERVSNGNSVRYYPIEYKSGTVKDSNCDELQLCAQAMALEEMMGTHIDTGFFYYYKIRRRATVNLDDELRTEAARTSDEMHG